MEIRRKLIAQMYGNAKLRKAIAFSIYVKSKTPSSAVPQWSVNKLRELTGVSAGAIKQRIRTLKEYDLITFVGKGENCAVFRSLRSSSSHRNVFIHETKFDGDKQKKKNNDAQSVKHIEDTLTAILIVEIQRHKDYARQMIQQKRSPKSLTDYKEARKVCNRCGYGEKYVERGLSYKTIAKRLGIGLQKAVETIKFAVEQKFLAKFKQTKRLFVANLRYIEDMLSFTYSYGNYIYSVYANRYALISHGNNRL